MAGTNVPKGAARREHIVRATLELIGERGTDAVTHRAVAERAGLPLSATTYWFDSKEELISEALRLANREEIDQCPSRASRFLSSPRACFSPSARLRCP